MARVLSLAGAGLPDTLVGPGSDNPTGFWESEKIVHLNDDILTQYNSSWDDEIPFAPGPDLAGPDCPYFARARKVLSEEFEDRT